MENYYWWEWKGDLRSIVKTQGQMGSEQWSNLQRMNNSIVFQMIPDHIKRYLSKWFYELILALILKPEKGREKYRQVSFMNIDVKL